MFLVHFLQNIFSFSFFFRLTLCNSRLCFSFNFIDDLVQFKNCLIMMTGQQVIFKDFEFLLIRRLTKVTYEYALFKSGMMQNNCIRCESYKHLKRLLAYFSVTLYLKMCVSPTLFKDGYPPLYLKMGNEYPPDLQQYP